MARHFVDDGQETPTNAGWFEATAPARTPWTRPIELHAPPVHVIAIGKFETRPKTTAPTTSHVMALQAIPVSAPPLDNGESLGDPSSLAGPHVPDVSVAMAARGDTMPPPTPTAKQVVGTGHPTLS